ncbi:hypothetical protein DACRYDRAFT_112206 [Dacryopinax primogenitus]|uniref:Uncharacterized protein n=1 Tax=Dacryopinax primogenitus (strain DJM 731) TaxID=1858805 RepID=M5FUF3_DACPD|nr:uncharacterized protein DACRYDRAFT_112206 [Dacryopinax primogenitus]EJT96866.1 hypothetical protein DACRYDRAFT_112206 [Dacryopinax primogenitus]
MSQGWGTQPPEIPKPDLEAIRATLVSSAASIESGRLAQGVHREMGLFLATPLISFDQLIAEKARFVVDWLKDCQTVEVNSDNHPSMVLGNPGAFKTAHPRLLVLHESAWEPSLAQDITFKVNE